MEKNYWEKEWLATEGFELRIYETMVKAFDTPCLIK